MQLFSGSAMRTRVPDAYFYLPDNEPSQCHNQYPLLKLNTDSITPNFNTRTITPHFIKITTSSRHSPTNPFKPTHLPLKTLQPCQSPLPTPLILN
jgi:hypothetical protein